MNTWKKKDILFTTTKIQPNTRYNNLYVRINTNKTIATNNDQQQKPQQRVNKNNNNVKDCNSLRTEPITKI